MQFVSTRQIGVQKWKESSRHLQRLTLNALYSEIIRLSAHSSILVFNENCTIFIKKKPDPHNVLFYVFMILLNRVRGV